MDSPSGSPQLPVPPTPVPVVAATPKTDATASDEQQAEAACHPHLVYSPDASPQIDTINLPEPNLAHIKVHFWVNGSGVVVREKLVSAAMGSPAEQQAELAFMRQLIFSVPDIADCRRREIELVGDVFETRNKSGAWTTYVRLYPRLSFDARGIVRSAD